MKKISITLYLVSIYILCRIYKIYSIDINELINYKKSMNNQTVFAIYGHTSFFDVPYILTATAKFGTDFIALAKKKYKWIYPKFMHSKLYFIEKQTTQKLKTTKNIGILLEGTRTKLPFIKSGFKYIALNNKANIVYVIINYKKNKVEISEPIRCEQLDKITDKDLLLPLRNLLKNKSSKEYSIYPAYCSDIKFK
jgi:1-acyl-sn-glycerol-3-phosphate acyltransferase